MLFSSYQFTFIFLPIVIMVYGLAHLHSARAGIVALMIASLSFYAAWKRVFLPLLIASIIVNYGLGLLIERSGRSRALTALGVALNLLVLGYFKYAAFVVGNVDHLVGTHLSFGQVVLPIGISFFTFQQIAYLVDVQRGEAAERDIISFTLFVSFFPHLIAGPLVHHAEMIPQFKNAKTQRHAVLVARGSAIAIAGLFKKVVLADSLAQFATPAFQHVDAGGSISASWAWMATLAYALQIYFDFSGYSDMAIGLALMFGIRLPVNFRSPYKARSIIEFWHCWHITLSRFLRDYLYIPLGGNRRGTPRRYLNVMATMLLGGLWHGAGWTFVIWGAIHGTCLLVNHGWRALRTQRPEPFQPCEMIPASVRRGVGWVATLAAVVVAWVFFRASTLHGARTMLSALFGSTPPGPGFAPPAIIRFGDLPWVLSAQTFWLVGVFVVGLGLGIAILLPNTAQLYRYREYRRGPDPNSLRLRWRPTLAWSAAVAGAFTFAVVGMWQRLEFLYFQF